MKIKHILIAFSVLAISVPAGAGNGNDSKAILAKNSNAFGSDISFIRSHKQGKGAEVNWGVTSTDGVAGFIVQRTYMDPNDRYSVWEDISSMACTSSKWFRCNDEKVDAGYISYRVLIVMSNGSKTVSPVSTVHIMSRF